MPDLYLPGATRVHCPAGGSLVGGAPRAVEHITADKLNPRPSMDDVAGYLVHMGFEPHGLIDPFTGRRLAFIAGNQSARALRNPAGGVQTNRLGVVCLQAEWYFTPGMVVAGKTYRTLRDTPMRGLDEWLAWCESWGVPSRWALAEPTWDSNRHLQTWQRVAGHYGHSQVPENDHTDPGPMPLAHVEESMPLTPEVEQRFTALQSKVDWLIDKRNDDYKVAFGRYVDMRALAVAHTKALAALAAKVGADDAELLQLAHELEDDLDALRAEAAKPATPPPG